MTISISVTDSMRNKNKEPPYFEHVRWQEMLISFSLPGLALHGALELQTRCEEADFDMVLCRSTRV